MATVLPYRPFDRAAADRRVRHPLQSLRGRIRTYVCLEGAAIALIYLALWFWSGLLLDYGSFYLFAFDWVQELNAAMSPNPALVFRAVLLAALLLGLVTVVALKIVRRLLREFSDAALALVLERRFPRKLGDRLITAVELADPKLATKYGFSQEMIDQTIHDAADRVERLPVGQVFNWGRLQRQWFLAGLCSIGIYLLGFLLYAAVALATGGWAGDYVPRFNNVAAIWIERNVLLMDTYWPRRAYLEILHFQAGESHPDEMRVARDEQRPDLLVRAYQWVVADRHVEGGWRPLRWKDLPQFVDVDLLDVKLPAEYEGWVIDLDDLDPSLPAGAVPPEWNGQLSGLFQDLFRRKDPQGWTQGMVPSKPYHLQDAFTNKLIEVGGKKLPPISTKAIPSLRRLLDWHEWTVDKLDLQRENAEVRRRLRRFAPREYAKLDKVFAKLAELADSPSMERTLRRLEVPEQVFFSYRGQTTKGETPHKLEEGRKYLVGLGELKESVRFTVRGEDYYTPSKRITLVPPPGLTELLMDKEEPAYIYWRLQGDQSPLRGKRQLFKDVKVSITGETTTIALPLGSSLQLHARVDRPLKSEVRLEAPANRKINGSTTPVTAVAVDNDGLGFRTGFRHVSRPIEFEFQFFDHDGVKGRRHVVIEPLDDRGPQEVVPVELMVALRQPKAAGGAGRAPSPGLTGFLVTPDAELPFKGTFTDEYGLTDVSWVWQVEEVPFELLGRLAGKKETKGKEGSLVLGGNSRLRRTSLVVSGLQAAPGGLGGSWAGPLYWSWVGQLIAFDLAHEAEGLGSFEGQAPLEIFQVRLHERDDEAIPLASLAEKLRSPNAKNKQLKTYSLKDNSELFDFRKFLPRLKSRDPAKEAQLHFRVRLYVSATDNNVETGSTPTGTKVLNKVPITFLVVSENELLAQILLEEEVLRERLEKALDKLKAARTILDEQLSKLQSPGAPLDLVALRVDDIRGKSLPDSSSLVREVSEAYNRILIEMQVNRVQKQYWQNVNEKICKPLEEVLNPHEGHFASTEAAIQKLWEGVDADAGRFKGQAEGKPLPVEAAQVLEEHRQNHLKAAGEAREQLTALIDRLDAVLQSIGGELVEREVIAMLLQIEQDQREQARTLNILYQRERDRVLQELQNPR
jgi:hypothetical protein